MLFSHFFFFYILNQGIPLKCAATPGVVFVDKTALNKF